MARVVGRWAGKGLASVGVWDAGWGWEWAGACTLRCVFGLSPEVEVEGVEGGEDDGMKDTANVPLNRTTLTASATGRTATRGLG